MSGRDGARLQGFLAQAIDLDQQLGAGTDAALAFKPVGTGRLQGDFLLCRASQHRQLAAGSLGVDRLTMPGDMDDHLVALSDDFELRLTGLGDNTAELRRIRRKAMSRAILREIAISLVWTIVGTVALLVGLAIAVVTS